MIWKIRLVKGLYHRGFRAEKVRRLFRVLDWLLRLPKETEKIVWKEIEKIERENAMPYVTSVERIGIERGLEMGMEKGFLAGIKALLTVKFGEKGIQAYQEIESTGNVEKLNSILNGLEKVTSIEEARRLWS